MSLGGSSWPNVNSESQSGSILSGIDVDQQQRGADNDFQEGPEDLQVNSYDTGDMRPTLPHSTMQTTRLDFPLESIATGISGSGAQSMKEQPMMLPQQYTSSQNEHAYQTPPGQSTGQNGVESHSTMYQHNAAARAGSDARSSATPKTGAGAASDREQSSGEVSRHGKSMVNPTAETRGKRPPWTELKTKAGKERKRLPLACIACRRKKIRCSGEKPSCKHCQRSRIPCVYKVAARKAAPRTDYMAMLDRRLKRMEERVIKIVPKRDQSSVAMVPRAVLKPQNQQTANGRKRGADEAFGSATDTWANVESNAQPQADKKLEDHSLGTEGAEFLPSKEIQEHLSETYFDYVYGQSYHLLHKPSYMRKLR